jgi:hypothetical protein
VSLVTKEHLQRAVKTGLLQKMVSASSSIASGHAAYAKSEAAIDRWVKDVAPSAELCRVSGRPRRSRRRRASHCEGHGALPPSQVEDLHGSSSTRGL